MTAEVQIHIDRHRPPTLTFEETNGEPMLGFIDELIDDDGKFNPIGWVLRVEHYQPFRLHLTKFQDAFAALDVAKQRLALPLPASHRLPGRSVSLRSATDGGSSYYLDATLETDGSLTLAGQNLGPTVSYDGEYEYWYTVQAEHVPALVVALGGEPGDDIIAVLERHWSGDAAVGIGGALNHSGVEFHFSDYF